MKRDNYIIKYIRYGDITLETDELHLKRYCVSEDFQGGDFGKDRDYTIDQWRKQAYTWCYLGESYGLMKIIKEIPDEELLDFISEVWCIKFREVRKNKKHLKNANDWNEITANKLYKEYINEE